MVRIISFALSMLAMALAAQACTNCQCHFSDGSHCCVVEAIDKDCTRVCTNALRGKDDKPCAAGGSYNCISEITSLGRMSCKGPTSQ